MISFFFKAFHLFKVLIDTGGKLITPLQLTDEVLNTQFHYRVDDCKALGYDFENCRLEEYIENDKSNINYSLMLKQLPLNINACHTYGFTMLTYNRK